MGGLGGQGGRASALSLSFQRESFILGLVNVLLPSGGDTLRIVVMLESDMLSTRDGTCSLVVAMATGERAEGLSNLALSDTMSI
jgi:hypothetical protein